jgi:hypothetical protein
MLFLYRDLVAYGGFVGDHDTGTFKHWRFLDCEARGGWASDYDLALLHRGSAASILVFMIDEWVQGGVREVSPEYPAALSTGRFDHLPEAKTALEAGLRGKRRCSRDRLRALEGGPDALVFTTTTGRQINRSNPYGATSFVRQARAPTCRGFRSFHTFRHTCASLLFAAGKNVKQVQAWVGHADPGFTVRTYIHRMDEGMGTPTSSTISSVAAVPLSER